jgi:hypothetical protein
VKTVDRWPDEDGLAEILADGRAAGTDTARPRAEPFLSMSSTGVMSVPGRGPPERVAELPALGRACGFADPP